MEQEPKIERGNREIATEMGSNLERLGVKIAQSHRSETSPEMKAELLEQMGGLLERMRELITELEK